jgi:BASS family bile acid:Na+ symporter
MKKALLLLVTIALGISIPQAAGFSFLIYYLLMLMLFFPFLEWKITTRVFTEKKIYLLLILNTSIGLLAYALVRSHHPELAIAAFLVGIAPTATACPAIISYLKGRVDFSIAAVLVTNVFMALFIPIAIYIFLDIDIAMSTMLTQTIILLALPLALGQLINRLLPTVRDRLVAFTQIGFYAWLLVCFLAIAKASAFIQSSDVTMHTILLVALVTGVLCLLNFTVGKVAGGKTLSLEMSQALGQKNTMLVVWIGLTYFNPLITLGPIFYLIWHNLYNAYQLAFYKNNSPQ